MGRISVCQSASVFRFFIVVSYQHPEGLNPWRRFRQAARIFLTTSRASNAGWYQSALESDFQVHLRTDGNRFDCLIYDRRSGEWQQGPPFTGEILTDEAATAEFSLRLLDLAVEAGAKAMGVVFHHAEDFATAELRKELDLKENLATIREEIEKDPKLVIADNSVSSEDNSWRVLPYAGPAESAAAIGVSRRWSPFLAALRNAGASRNFPVVTQALSGPLIALLSLAEFKRSDLDRPFVAILPYPRFTLVGFFDSLGNLLLLRSVQHRGQRGPVNLRQVLASTAAALEMTGPDIDFIPTDAAAEQQILEDLGLVSQDEIPGVYRYPNAAPASGLLVPLEFRVATTLDSVVGTPLGESRTFSSFRSDGWAAQDFLPPSPADREVFPTRTEMRLLRASRLLRTALFLIASCGLLYFSKEIVQMVGKPEWSYKPQDGLNLKQQATLLGQQKGQLEFWDNLLGDRSRAWSAAEVLPRLAKNPADMLIKGFYYSAAPTTRSGQAKQGFAKEWKISGFIRRQELEKLNQEDISAIFNEIAHDTGSESFRTDIPTRSLMVNVKTQENPSFKKPVGLAGDPAEAAFPFLFDLTITQRFETADPEAFNTAKAP
jgi:hypothetical protein